MEPGRLTAERLMRDSEAAALARVGRRWRWWQGAGGGPARLPWTSPKPVTPRHLETITGTMKGVGSLAARARALSVWDSKGPEACRHPRPHLHRHCLPWPGHTGPLGQLSGKASPCAAVGAAGQQSGGPSRLSFRLSLQDSELIIVPPGALVSPKEAQVPPSRLAAHHMPAWI